MGNEAILGFLRDNRDRVGQIRVVSIPMTGVDQKTQVLPYVRGLKRNFPGLSAFATDQEEMLLFIQGARRPQVECHLTPLRSANPHIAILVEDLLPQLPRLVEKLKSCARPDAKEASRTPATWSDLAEAAAELMRADLTPVLFNQRVFALADRGGLPLFTELFVNIRQVEEIFCPDRSILGNRWVFRDFTRCLDHAVLAHLPRLDDAIPAGAFSLNLNISTVLSEEFRAFVDKLPVSRRGMMVVELQRTDVVEHLATFEAVRGLLRREDIAVCLDGVEMDHLPLLNIDGLGCDFVKLLWDDRLLSGGNQSHIAAIIRSRTPVILSRCDNPKAIALAREAGIGFAQGRVIERMVDREMADLRLKTEKPGGASNPIIKSTEVTSKLLEMI